MYYPKVFLSALATVLLSGTAFADTALVGGAKPPTDTFPLEVACTQINEAIRHTKEHVKDFGYQDGGFITWTEIGDNHEGELYLHPVLQFVRDYVRKQFAHPQENDAYNAYLTYHVIMNCRAHPEETGLTALTQAIKDEVPSSTAMSTPPPDDPHTPITRHNLFQ